MKAVLDLQAGAAAAETVRLLKEMLEEATMEQAEAEENAKIELERAKRKLEAIEVEAKNKEKHVKRQLKNPPIELLRKEGFNYDFRNPDERTQQRLYDIEAEESDGTIDEKEEEDDSGNAEKGKEESVGVGVVSAKPERLVQKSSEVDENTSSEEEGGKESQKERLTEEDGGEEDLFLKKGALLRLLRPVYKLGLFRTWE